MTQEQWILVRELFNQAIELPPKERTSFVREHCKADEVVRLEVESLLAAHPQADGFLSGSPFSEPVGAGAGPLLAAGSRLEQFEIEALIGAGGMGEVYRARDVRLDRHVAIKVLSLPMVGDARRREQFHQEARLLSKLAHPHICTLHDVGTFAGPSGEMDFLVMEMLDGETLAARLRRGAMPVPQAVGAAIQIAEALAEAHAVGIVHRDLKPGNVMITRSGVKLIDFGLSRLRPPVHGAAPEASLPGPATAEGILAGTLPYMAPEQLRAQHVDARADLFAFGAILYEMVAGVRPFAGDSPAELAAAILEREPVPLSIRQPLVPPGLDRLVTASLAKDPAQRWQTARDLLRELTWIRDRDRASHPMSSAAADQPRRHRTRAWAAAPWILAGTFAAVLAAVVTTSLFSRRSDTAAAPVVVLSVRPFDSPSNPPLGVGLADVISARLGGQQAITVRSRGSDVTHVLAGQVAISGDEVTVVARLQDVARGADVWSDRIRVRVDRLFSVEDVVAERVVTALRLRLAAAEQERLRRRYTSNNGAYEHYLRGRAALVKYTPEGTQTAIEAFEAALRDDADYALARAGLAMAYADMYLRFATAGEVERWAERAEKEARLALALDPDLAEAHLARAAVARKREFDWGATLSAARRALVLNPNLEQARFFAAAAYYHTGYMEEAIIEMEKGRSLHGLDLIEPIRLEGLVSLFSGSFAPARAHLEEVSRLSSQPIGDTYLALAYFYTGSAERAVANLQALSTNRSASTAARAGAALAGILASQGQAAVARARLEEVLKGSYRDHHVAYSIGVAYTQLGDLEEAERWLRTAADTGFPCLPFFDRDPLLEPIRRASVFKDLLAYVRARRDSAFAGLTQ